VLRVGLHDLDVIRKAQESTRVLWSSKMRHRRLNCEYYGGSRLRLAGVGELGGSYTHYLNTTYLPGNPGMTGAQLQLGSLSGFCNRGRGTSPCGSALALRLLFAYEAGPSLAMALGSVPGFIAQAAQQARPGTPTQELRIQAEAEQALADLECGGASFTPRTKVLLANGTTVPLSSLRPGDKVLATNTRTGHTQAEPITAVLIHHDTNRYNLIITTGRRTSVIHTTTTHLFWDPAAHHWTKAATLRHGSHLRTPNTATAVSIVRGYTPRHQAGWMWDLTVTTDHDFYVVGRGAPVLVHNCPNYSPSGNAAQFSTEEIAQLAYQHIGAGDIAGRPSLGEIQTTLNHGQPVPLQGQNAVQIEYNGVRVIVN
jgi:hypothetical protein